MKRPFALTVIVAILIIAAFGALSTETVVSRVWPFANDFLRGVFLSEFHAEFGTDAVIRQRYFPDYHYKGTMVEVGAGPPVYYSMSKHWRDTGWRCVCIEPNPKFVAQHRAAGNEIYQLACAAENKKDVDFQIVTEDRQWATENDGLSSSALAIGETDSNHARIATIKVEVRRLDDILHDLNVSDVDLVSIDVEGWELEVMRGFTMRPRVIVLENSDHDPKQAEFMKERGYRLDGKVQYNYLYVRDGAL